MLIAPLLALSLISTEPARLSYRDQWTGTCVPHETLVITFTSTAATKAARTKTTSTLHLWGLPAQARAVCDVDAKLCWSQDPTPIITSAGVFSYDPRRVYDGTGASKCMDFAAGIPDYLGTIAEEFLPQANDSGTQPSGARHKQCGSTRQPCAHDSECSSGTCSLTQEPRTVYLFGIAAGGTGSCKVVDCR